MDCAEDTSERHDVICPICMWHGEKFLPKNGRDNVLCPKCGSFERHRHQFFVGRKTGILDNLLTKNVLHVGPEPCERVILCAAREYITMDIQPSRAQVTADLTKMPFADLFFDLVWASHVLEHITTVDLAVREVFRVLKSSGAAVLDVPIYGSETLRLTQPDRHGHVWHPGRDWPQLYKKAGFVCELFYAEQCPGIYGPLDDSLVAVCRKPSPSHEKCCDF